METKPIRHTGLHCRRRCRACRRRCSPSVAAGHAAGARAGQGLRGTRSKAHGGALAHSARVVLPAVVVGVEELFEPLQELEIVLEPPLDQLVNGYNLKENG